MSGISNVSFELVEAEKAEVLMTPDGKTIVIEYDIGASEPLRIALPYDLTRDLMARITQVASATLNGPGFVRMTPVTAVNAQPTDIPNHLSLTLYDELKLPHHFALPIELSALLRPRLRSVEAASKQGVKIGRA